MELTVNATVERVHLDPKGQVKLILIVDPADLQNLLEAKLSRKKLQVKLTQAPA